MKIDLNELELNIFQILLNANYEQQCGSVIRVCGGWVRDKLMGLESKDIDLLIDNMSGLSFATRVAKHLGLGDKVGVIKANPEKSKHIESAVMFIDGQEIQFTGCRKETYTSESRIPITETGSLLEDVYRRDFTINSMYYNINDGKLEDLSGLGLVDLNRKTIQLMVPPKNMWKQMNINNILEANKKSFTDDPLRILRAIRFACRFNFGLDKQLVECAQDEDVLDAFNKKVSRERIEIEFKKMLSDNDPDRAVSLMKDLGVFDTVVMLPKGYYDWAMNQNTPYHKLNVWEHTLTALENLQVIIKDVNLNKDDKFALNMAILLHDTGKLNPIVHGKKHSDQGERTTYYGHEQHSLSAVSYIAENLPGISNTEVKRIQTLIEGSSRVNPNYVAGNLKCNLSRRALGRFVRLTGDDWKNAMYVHMADATSKAKGMLKDFDFTYHQDMMSKITNMNPRQIQNMKPLLNGNEISAMINRKPGPWLKNVMDKMIDWQLKNQRVSKKDAEGFVKSFRL